MIYPGLFYVLLYSSAFERAATTRGRVQPHLNTNVLLIQRACSPHCSNTGVVSGKKHTSPANQSACAVLNLKSSKYTGQTYRNSRS